MVVAILPRVMRRAPCLRSGSACSRFEIARAVGEHLLGQPGPDPGCVVGVAGRGHPHRQRAVAWTARPRAPTARRRPRPRPPRPARRSARSSRPRGWPARRARPRRRRGWRGRRARPARPARSSSARHSTASAPCPGAGSICSGSSTSVTSSSRPIRASPARARSTASYSPERTLPIRVSTLPRTPTTSKPRPRACSCATRRGEPVPTRAAGRQLAEGEPVAGHDDVARVLAQGYGGQRDPVGARRSGGP